MGADTATVAEVVSLNNNFPFGMMVAGIILTIAGAIKCDENDCEGDGEALAVALGVINTVLAIIYLLALYKNAISDMIDLVLVIVMFGLWVFTAGYLTFEDPFLVPSNGYVAAWLGAMAATGNLVYSSKFAAGMKTQAQGQSLPLMLMMGASVVVIIAAIANGCCDGQQILAVVAGIVGLVTGIIRLAVGASIDRSVSAFLAVWWLVCGVILTFGEFEEIGNGYLGTWVAIISSCVMAVQSR